MKDSARTKPDDSSSTVERPSWRFSGRRGTPVHLREQAPQTLPPEIRKAVTQLARERAGESASTSDAKSARAMPDLKLGRRDGQAPPVAAASLPVERRNRREADPVVPTSHIPAATAPIAEPAREQADVVADVPTIEAPVEVQEPAIAPAAEATTTDAPEATPALEAEQASNAAPTTSPSPPMRLKLSSAERKKAAKARAKAKAKAGRTLKQDANGTVAAEKARRLFARGRDVDADTAAAIEFSRVAETTETNQPVVEAPGSDTPIHEPMSVDAPMSDVPLSPVAGDLPDAIPSLDAIDDVEPLSFPTLEPAASTELESAEPEVPTPGPEPALATEFAAQAAWELGRLPFLVHDRPPEAVAPVAAPTDVLWEIEPSKLADPARTRSTIEPPALLDSEAPVRAAVEPTVEPAVEPLAAWTEPVPIRSSLQPFAWLPVGSNPIPAPIEPLDQPRRTTPDAIQRLAAPLEVPRGDQARARVGAREDTNASTRTAEARRRISRRRAELDDVVVSLAGLGSGRRDS